METSFKFSRKLKKYIQIDYITGLEYTPINYQANVWVTNKDSAREFINRVKEMESHIKNKLIKNSLPYDFRLIMLAWLKVIDNISTGLDIRSDMSSLALAELFVSTYDKKYKEAYKFCKDTLEYVDSEGKFESYMKNWKRYDKHNELVREYYLPLKSLNLEDFQVDHLKNALEATEALNKRIDELKNKQ